MATSAMPLAMRREGDHLVIEWSDGLVARLDWKTLRNACPCAGCKDERATPPAPFRLPKPEELVPLAPAGMPRVGRYAYKIVWSDGHDTGIYTLEHLYELSRAAAPAR